MLIIIFTSFENDRNLSSVVSLPTTNSSSLKSKQYKLNFFEVLQRKYQSFELCLYENINMIIMCIKK